VALFSFSEPFAPWLWYNQGAYPSVATGTLAINDANLVQLQATLEDYTYVLAFDYLRDLTDPNDALLQMLEENNYQAMDFIDQANIGFVRIYARPQIELSENE
jgi:ABC-type metal ion transport system substrate-binding protein